MNASNIEVISKEVFIREPMTRLKNLKVLYQIVYGGAFCKYMNTKGVLIYYQFFGLICLSVIILCVRFKINVTNEILYITIILPTLYIYLFLTSTYGLY